MHIENTSGEREVANRYIPITIDPVTPITPEVIAACIKQHQNELPRLERLQNYYFGEHDILHRQKAADLSNRKVVCNHAKHISDTVSGFFMGAPIVYTAAEQAHTETVATLVDWFRAAGTEEVDIDLSLTASIFGRAYELTYMSDDEKPIPKVHCFSPMRAFIVYDDTVEKRPMVGVMYYRTYDLNGTPNGYRITWSTETEIVTARMSLSFEINIEAIESNPFGRVTLTEYLNDGNGVGDYEPVLTEIDAYNILQSDRINDIEQNVDSILVIEGQVLGDDDEESAENLDAVKRNKVLLLGEGSKASYLKNALDVSAVEETRRSLEEDIHKFSNTVCFSDENFAGSQSGEAMKYKLLGMTQKFEIKERYFRKGLKNRVKLFSAIMQTKGLSPVPEDAVEFTFKPNLPADEARAAQIVAQLSGLLPDEILFSILPFVKDPTAAAEQMQKQKEEAARQQQRMFAQSALSDGVKDDEDDDE